MSGDLTGRFRTPWGEGSVTVRRGRLIGVDLPPSGATRAGAPGPEVPVPGSEVSAPSAETDPGERAALDRWVEELEAYFRGERLAWGGEDVSLDELAAGSFDRAVYATLLSVPPAVTVSYGTLAEMAGYPRAARAVGNAMASNPVPVVIPCHRVIRSDGSLGNYGDDPAWKERLLEHERQHAGGGADGR